MLTILAITGPIYLAIAVGYAATRSGLFARTEMAVFGRFVLYLALPALLFSAISQRRLGDIFNITYLAAYGLGSLATLAIGYLASRLIGRAGKAESAINAMGMSCSNSGYVGFPILLLTLPQIAGVAVALNMLVENLIMLPILFVLADREADAHLTLTGVVRAAAARLVRNPLVIAMAAGVLVSNSGLHLPDVISRTVTMFSQASVAVSLFVIGGVLAGDRVDGLAANALPIALGKLVLHPALVLAFVAGLPLVGLPALSPPMTVAAVLLAAMPMLGIYTILAQRYRQEARSAAALLIATALSFFTLSGLLWLLARQGLVG